MNLKYGEYNDDLQTQILTATLEQRKGLLAIDTACFINLFAKKDKQYQLLDI